MAIKTENQIYKDFIFFVRSIITAAGITDWQVKKLNQVVKTEELKPCIFLQVILKKQDGAQYRQNLIYIKKYKSKQEVTVRYSATRRFKLSDDAATINSSDVLTIIKNYIQSLEGIKMLAGKGYAQYRSTEIKNESFTNDDENVQLMPFFECVYLFTDEWQNQTNKLDRVKMKTIKGV